MNKRKLWIALVAGLALGGCSGQTPPPPEKKSEAPAPQALVQAPATPAAPAASKKHTPTKHCRDSDPKCDVTVTITSCTPDGVTLDHEVLGVRKGSRNVNVDWIIVTKGYQFKDDGIKFKTDGWQAEFDQPKANKDHFRWRDLNSAGGADEREYSYGITIYKDDGSPCTTKDPFVVNDT